MPIIYTSLAIFFGIFITILIISYISYKFKAGKKDKYSEHEGISYKDNLIYQNKKLAQVPVYDVNQAKHYQTNNYQTKKENVQRQRVSPSVVYQVPKQANPKDHETTTSKPRVQVVKKLSRQQEEPGKVPVQNNTSYNESSFYKYYAQG
jgi:hypothetical protein